MNDLILVKLFCAEQLKKTKTEYNISTQIAYQAVIDYIEGLERKNKEQGLDEFKFIGQEVPILNLLG